MNRKKTRRPVIEDRTTMDHMVAEWLLQMLELSKQHKTCAADQPLTSGSPSAMSTEQKQLFDEFAEAFVKL